MPVARLLATGVDVKFVLGKELLPVFPLVEAGEDIGTGKQDKFVRGVFLLDIGQRIDGIGGLRQVEFDVGGFEPGLVLHRHVDHIQPVDIGQERRFLLERIVRRDDKPHILDVGELDHVAGDHQVPEMDWVEGSEKESGFT